ncbi:hypothetical protein JOY44_31080 (plasmid) [Phormidium sp. CLA17]|uniref:hypothetical protein n=1 Tax=Leptolyngbya sp. Cla-17 TaxID=2803751 RepID=UPI001492A2B7|nr:hypothetical protein [Leptolyngbya sp. Cla-17]MBM0745807.1 hypothetical protein [Leptolyngbya sp. Cla-17]
MIRILHATLASAMLCRPQHGLGRAAVLFAFEGRIGLAAVNPSAKALISKSPDDSIRINSLAAGGAGQS